MPSQSTADDEPRLRPSGYASRLYEIGYENAAPFYDLIVLMNAEQNDGNLRGNDSKSALPFYVSHFTP